MSALPVAPRRTALLGTLAFALGSCGAPPQATIPTTLSAENLVINVGGFPTRSGASRVGATCYTPGGDEAARQCGTLDIRLDLIGILNPDHVGLPGFGEESPPIADAVAAYNRVLADLHKSAPADFTGALASARSTIRHHLVSVCTIEARRFRGENDRITVELFVLYAWIGFRQSLIDGGEQAVLWEDVIALPCFERTRNFLFGASPGFLSKATGSFYAFPSYFARALAAHFHAKRQESLADAFWYRAELGDADDRKVSCIVGPLASQYPSPRMALPELWGICAVNAARGQSCLATLRSCGGPATPPPWTKSP
ncbi:hypothetical protein [Sphingomonas hengshuiensis]|uniref:hypothetical protein n=1 Tax=Sphingomonas hengshuiensis TaxID=1609977 RepID=UPI0012B95758|nr:hypothetical protein [Sphingomonas hengshuiensis]